jgi:hypothetical protein
VKVELPPQGGAPYIHSRTSLWSSRSLFPRKSDFGGAETARPQRPWKQSARNPETKLTRWNAPTWGYLAPPPWKSPPRGDLEPRTRTVLSTARDGVAARSWPKRHQHRLYQTRQSLGKRLHREIQNAQLNKVQKIIAFRSACLPQRTPRRRGILLARRSANPYRELACAPTTVLGPTRLCSCPRSRRGRLG